jgi:hypothetical protein
MFPSAAISYRSIGHVAENLKDESHICQTDVGFSF